MSYADVAAHNAPPASQQPRPDPSLVEGSHGNTAGITQHPDVNTGKVNVVPAGSDLEHLSTETGEEFEAAEKRTKAEVERLQAEAKKHLEQGTEEGKRLADKASKEAKDLLGRAEEQAKKAEKKISRAADKAGKEASDFWQKFSSNPEYWASTLGAVNAALLIGGGVWVYANRDQARSWDRRIVSGVGVGILSLLGLQSYAASEAALKQKGKK